MTCMVPCRDARLLVSEANIDCCGSRPEAQRRDEAVAALGQVGTHDGCGADADGVDGTQALRRAVLPQQHRHQRGDTAYGGGIPKTIDA